MRSLTAVEVVELAGADRLFDLDQVAERNERAGSASHVEPLERLGNHAALAVTLGNVKGDLQPGRLIERHQGIADGDIIAHVDRTVGGHGVGRGADPRVFDLLLDQGDGRLEPLNLLLGRLSPLPGGVPCLLGDHIALQQRVVPIELPLGGLQCGFGGVEGLPALGELALELAVVEQKQQIALLDGLAFAELDLLDESGQFRADLDATGRLQRSDAPHRLPKRCRLDFGHFDEHGPFVARGSGRPTGAAPLATGRQDQRREEPGIRGIQALRLRHENRPESYVIARSVPIIGPGSGGPRIRR
jgi:hypothetical protein